jgi:hypothetical protein
VRDGERRRRYAEELGEEALRRQVDESKVRRKCCGTWKHEPHDGACRVGRRGERARS